MKKSIALATAAALFAAPAMAETVKLGVLLGFTGPIESLTPDMAAGAEMAMAEASKSGKFMGGSTIESVRGDSTCVDAAAATATAERLITSDKVAAIMGADCSGVTTAVLQNVATAKGIVMISPSATSPALSTIQDNGLFFRTSPSDARQGQVLAEVLKERGVKSAAISYTNNDYGKGLADSIQGGKGIIQASLDAGAFDTFVLPDGMIGDSLPEAIGSDLDGSYGTLPAAQGDGVAMFEKLAIEAGFKPGPYAPQSYDAAALMILAMQASGSSDSNKFKAKIMDVANAPGEKINPGELGKALDILAAGGDVDYVGASDVELIGPGESAGSFQEVVIKNKKITPVKFR